MRARRLLFLAAGWALLGAALSPPVDALADRRLVWHMVQHAVLIGVVPPLLVLGEPLRLALELLPRDRARSLVAALHRPAARLLLSPGFALVFFAVIVLGTHLPLVFDVAQRSDPLHAAEHLAYLGAGLLLWATIVGADPTRRPLSAIAVVGLIGAAMVPMLAVGVLLATASHVVYELYAQIRGASAGQAEQQAAATAMWAGDTPLAAAIVLAGWAALLREERRQRAREAAADRETAKMVLEDKFLRSREGGVA